MARRFILESDSDAVQVNLTLDYTGALNERQHLAVTSGGGPALVIAGAGTGKTRTLVYRVAYLVESGVQPHRIVLLTFTRRAAAQMIERASSLLDGRCRDVQGGTFHSYCLGVLRRHGQAVGLPQAFTVLDESDAADIVNVIRTSRGFHKLEERFPRKDALLSMISAGVNRQKPLETVIESDYPQFLSHAARIAEVRADYHAYKRGHGLADYDDLLSLTHRLFEENPAIRSAVAYECEHVLVDEYQDTNRLQAMLVAHISSYHGSVMVVGDDAQSIYRFRGADYTNLFRFEDRFPGSARFTLEENYRSRQPILDLANGVIEQATKKFDKRLWSRMPDGDLPGLVPTPDERTESRFVSQMVLQLREEGVPLNRMAVLFRSSSASFDLELELNRRRIPFVKYGGTKLAEAAHIKDVIAHLRVVENPNDAVSWNRILLLLEGLGPKSAGDLVEWISSVQDPFSVDPPYASPRYVQDIQRLFGVLRGLRSTETPVGDEVERIIEYYEPMMAKLFPDDSDRRGRDLEHFIGLARNAESRQNFLSELVLDPVEISVLETRARQQDEPALILSTIHSAKGLEFDTVFIIQALEGSIPSAFSLNNDEEIDEELRLFYVAITRAERNLFISYPSVRYRRGFGDYFAQPTRFLNDIGDDLIERWEIVAAKPQSGSPQVGPTDIPNALPPANEDR